MLEADFAQQVQAQERKAHNPDGQVHLPVQQVPVVGLVRRAQEFKAQGHLNKAQHHFDAVEPAAALGKLFEHRREEGQEGKRQGKGNAEGQHGDHRGPEFPLGALDKDRTHNGTGAAEAHQHQRQRQEKHAQQASFVTLGICLGGPAGRQGNLKRTKERRRKQHENHKEQDVGEPVRTEPVKDIGRHRFTAQKPRKANDQANGNGIEQDDENAVHEGFESAPLLLLDEEGHRHGHHGEHARGQEHEEAPQDGLQDKAPQIAGRGRQ